MPLNPDGDAGGQLVTIATGKHQNNGNSGNNCQRRNDRMKVFDKTGAGLYIKSRSNIAKSLANAQDNIRRRRRQHTSIAWFTAASGDWPDDRHCLQPPSRYPVQILLIIWTRMLTTKPRRINVIKLPKSYCKHIYENSNMASWGNKAGRKYYPHRRHITSSRYPPDSPTAWGFNPQCHCRNRNCGTTSQSHKTIKCGKKS